MDFPVVCTSAELDSSYELLRFPNGDIDEMVRRRLVEEADRRNYVEGQLIVFSERARDSELDWNSLEYPTLDCYIKIQRTASLAQLRARML